MTEPIISTLAVDDEYTAAERELYRLEERVLDGDTDVTADDIETARKRLDFLGLRRKAAERAEAKQAEAEHQKRVEEFEQRVATFRGKDLDDARKAYRVTVEAAAILHQILTARQVQRSRLEVTGRKLGVEVKFGMSDSAGPEYVDQAITEAKTGRPPTNHNVLMNDPRYYLHGLSDPVEVKEANEKATEIRDKETAKREARRKATEERAATAHREHLEKIRAAEARA